MWRCLADDVSLLRASHHSVRAFLSLHFSDMLWVCLSSWCELVRNGAHFWGEPVPVLCVRPLVVVVTLWLSARWCLVLMLCSTRCVLFWLWVLATVPIRLFPFRVVCCRVHTQGTLCTSRHVALLSLGDGCRAKPTSASLAGGVSCILVLLP